MNGALLPAAANSIVTSTVLPTFTSVAAAAAVSKETLNPRLNAEMAAGLKWDLNDEPNARYYTRTSDYKKRRREHRKKLLRQSRREERSLFQGHVKRKVKFFSKTERILQIWPDGTVNGTNTAENSPYGILNLITVLTSMAYKWPADKKKPAQTVLSIQGIKSSRYLCMDNRGRLYGGINRTDECLFYSKYLPHHYEVFYSKKYYTNSTSGRKRWYIAMNKNGRPRSGRKTLSQQDRAQWIKKPLDDVFAPKGGDERVFGYVGSTMAPVTTETPHIRHSKHNKRCNRRKRRGCGRSRKRNKKHNKDKNNNDNKNNRDRAEKESQKKTDLRAVSEDSKKDVESLIVELSGNDKSLAKQNEKLQSQNQKTETISEHVGGNAASRTALQAVRPTNPSEIPCGGGGGDTSKSRSTRRRKKKHRKRRKRKGKRHRKNRNRDRTISG
ncbi:protein let-756 [Lingula anatina]|uniref:Protein let-756 n=1 Tax=Lingula anatina TaxID=7574 RepID=A0A1S3JQZ7_LINAN|nr:protein let-756 [Lingula anatina]|eukprot:XP_013412795.1 protein let-756 [Lingula anatina]